MQCGTDKSFYGNKNIRLEQSIVAAQQFALVRNHRDPVYWDTLKKLYPDLSTCMYKLGKIVVVPANPQYLEELRSIPGFRGTDQLDAFKVIVDTDETWNQLLTAEHEHFESLR